MFVQLTQARPIVCAIPVCSTINSMYRTCQRHYTRADSVPDHVRVQSYR